MTDELLSLLGKCRIFDLAQPYFIGMPHFPTHPPYLYSLSKLHGDMVSPAGTSSAADAISMGTHVGTHIDGLGHFSCAGKLYGGHETEGAQSYTEGLSVHAVDRIAPIIRRGVLLDLAPGGVLTEDATVSPDDLRAAAQRSSVEIREGDVVLLRTGWGRYWEEGACFVNAKSGAVTGPGPRIEGARWLSGHGIFAAGSDTVAFEKLPAPDMPVHVHFLVERGIHIIECLQLDELAMAGCYEFLFTAVPLKLRGATGSPLRPLALAPQSL